MIRLEGVSVRFPLPGGGAHEALSGVDLEVRRGESLCLIGPSGCGKTTTLRLVNRLVEPSAGRVLVGGRDVAQVDPIALRRGIGYVVQQGGLFPHLTVRGNIALLCRLDGWSTARTRRRVDELLAMVRLDPARFASRYPCELSGGQRQRVGVARALALDPPVVLLDEPFGALDPITRGELQAEFRELRGGAERTLVLVTHDLAEAFALGDRVALLRRGRIEQVGPPAALRDAPASAYVERFVAHQLAAPDPA